MRESVVSVRHATTAYGELVPVFRKRYKREHLQIMNTKVKRPLLDRKVTFLISGVPESIRTTGPLVLETRYVTN